MFPSGYVHREDLQALTVLRRVALLQGIQQAAVRCIFRLFRKSVCCTRSLLRLLNRLSGFTRETEIKVAKRSSFSTGQLKRLLAAHLRPINLVVFQGTSTKPDLGTGFVLICFQHLSYPYVATLRCLERDNRNTRGTSLQILSY